MPRIWRSPGALMTAYLVLFVLAGRWGDVSRPGPHGLTSTGRDLPTIAIAAFLTWRVARGGPISRCLIIIYTIIGAGAVINSGSARSGDPVAFGLLAIYLLQLGILLSTPVYNHTHQDGTGRQPVAARFWEVPPLWMPFAAAASGLVITLLFLGNMSFQPVSDCQAPGSLAPHAAPLASCVTLAEGYPAHFLSASPSVTLNSGSAVTAANMNVFASPYVNKGAAAEDLAIWAVASFLACYLLWLPSRRPTRSAATDQPVPA